jgi:hypothetical protein
MGAKMRDIIGNDLKQELQLLSSMAQEQSEQPKHPVAITAMFTITLAVLFGIISYQDFPEDFKSRLHTYEIATLLMVNYRSLQCIGEEPPSTRRDVDCRCGKAMRIQTHPGSLRRVRPSIWKVKSRQ